MPNEIIGITGPIAAGKDEAARLLASQLDMQAYRISDALKSIACKRGIEPTRANLVQLGTDVADAHGDEYLAQYVLDHAPKNFIVTGVRQLGQLALFGSAGKFRLISIDADPEVRFARAIHSGKLGEANTFEKFIQNELAENRPPNVQRVQRCMQLADQHVTNDGTIDELHAKLDSAFWS